MNITFCRDRPHPIHHPSCCIHHQCSEQAFDDFFEIHKTVLNILQLGALKVIAIYLARMQTTYAICYKPKSQQVLQILLICTSHPIDLPTLLYLCCQDIASIHLYKL